MVLLLDAIDVTSYNGRRRYSDSTVSRRHNPHRLTRANDTFDGGSDATSSYGRRRSSYSTVRGRYNATSLANGAFMKDKFTVRPSFTYTLAVYYSAGFKLLDFNNDPTGSARYVNEWVKDATDDKIQELVNAMLLAGSPLVLVNVIYFKGDWMDRFSPAVPTPFYVSDTETIQVDMMDKLLPSDTP